MNLAHVHETLAAAMPDREALVFRDRRLTWAQLTDRTRRLADVLRRHGLGCPCLHIGDEDLRTLSGEMTGGGGTQT